MARATLAPRPGMAGEVPPLRKRPIATMKDMGMDMSNMPGMEGMDMSGGARDADPTAEQNASAKLATGGGAAMGAMDHGAMPGMDHGSMPGMDHGAMAGMDHGSMKMRDFSNAPQVRKGPGVQTISPMPMDRTGEPGQGLEDVGHKVLVYKRPGGARAQCRTCARRRAASTGPPHRQHGTLHVVDGRQDHVGQAHEPLPMHRGRTGAREHWSTIR
jgi:hypothetical protein